MDGMEPSKGGEGTLSASKRTRSSASKRAKAGGEGKTEAADASLDLAHRISRLMLERKADQVTILQMASLTSFADYFVLGTAQSDRQVHALSRFLAETLKKEGHPALSTEGEDHSHWVLLDFGGVVAHVFYEPARNYYDLDGLWADAPRVIVQDAEAELKAAARKRSASASKQTKSRSR
jgi:ribosome-associated protein